AEPDNVDFLSLKAQALRLLGRGNEAIALMEGAVAAHPQEDRAWVLRGHLLREVGQQARAIEMYRHALEIRPDCGRALSSLANRKTFRFSSADITAMQEQVGRDTLRAADRVYFEFALGKAFEDEAGFAASFEHYARGNSLQRPLVFHDANATRTDVLRAKEL